MEEIGDAFEIRMGKKIVKIDGPYQVGIAVYQLAKMGMLQLYYDFIRSFISERDFELLQMDTDSLYMAISEETIDVIIEPEPKEEYEESVKSQWFMTDKYSGRTPGLYKLEFAGKRMISLASKCYFTDGQYPKVSCKGVSKRQNEMVWERYKEALLGSKDYARNTGFRMEGNNVVTYSQKKLGLSAYYDKRKVHQDGIHTEPLW